ncbi:phage tail protein, partial [Escherichia coli]|nr:phage tail protein [Escherichia coli]
MNLLVKVTHIFRLIQVCQQTVPILHHQIFLLA